MKDRIAVFAIMNVVDRHLQKRYIRTTGASIKRREMCIRDSYREYPFIRLYFQVYFSHLPVNNITNLPQFRFRFTEYQSVIAIDVYKRQPIQSRLRL